jgi:hypothetical protein
MKVTASYGPTRTHRTTAFALVAASMLTVMLVAQLYAFEEFAPILMQIMKVSEAGTSFLAAAMLVIAELFTLPYLLGMYTSRLFRYVSAGLAFVVSGYWLFSAFTNSHAVNAGLFSSALAVPGGILAAVWTAIVFFLVITVIAADSRFRHASS